MESANSIKHEIGHIENDVGVFDRYSVKSDILKPHPLESAYQSVIFLCLFLWVFFKLNILWWIVWKDLIFFLQAIKSEEDMKRKVLAHTYGSAFPLKMELDNQILSR